MGRGDNPGIKKVIETTHQRDNSRLCHRFTYALDWLARRLCVVLHRYWALLATEEKYSTWVHRQASVMHSSDCSAGTTEAMAMQRSTSQGLTRAAVCTREREREAPTTRIPASATDGIGWWRGQYSHPIPPCPKVWGNGQSCRGGFRRAVASQICDVHYFEPLYHGTLPLCKYEAP